MKETLEVSQFNRESCPNLAEGASLISYPIPSPPSLVPLDSLECNCFIMPPLCGVHAVMS